MQCKKIIGLPVETESGESVGKVADLHVDIDTHDVRTYVVSASGFLRGLVGGDGELEVLPSHVRSIGEDKMVIADLTGTQGSGGQKMTQELDASGVGTIPRPVVTEVE